MDVKKEKKCWIFSKIRWNDGRGGNFLMTDEELRKLLEQLKKDLDKFNKELEEFLESGEIDGQRIF